MSVLSTGVTRDCVVRVVGFDLECAECAWRGLHAVLLLFVRVGCLSDLFHVFINSFFASSSTVPAMMRLASQSSGRS